MPLWDSSKGDIPYGDMPNTFAVSSGGSTANSLVPGVLTRQISSAGVSPGATGADNVIAAYTIPANVFDIANRGILIQARGGYAANGNTKRVKMIINPASATIGSTVGASGTTIADSGAVTSNGLGWVLTASVWKYGAAGSNTQLAINELNLSGTTVGGLILPAALTLTESGTVLLAITGNATTTATDILFNFLLVQAFN